MAKILFFLHKELARIFLDICAYLFFTGHILSYRQFTAGVEMVELDASGRILLQKRHIDAIGVSTDVLFVGVGNYFEIWSKANFEADLYGESDFSEALQSKMGNLSF